MQGEGHRFGVPGVPAKAQKRRRAIVRLCLGRDSHSGERRRPPLMKAGSRGTSPEFDLLTGTISHLPALMAVGECYLALPNPDANFVTDLQTNNFASRLFELYLLACFREQGLMIRQDHVSPDFWIERDGAACWIEAVTADSEVPRAGGIGLWVHAPEDRNERLTGGPAERFAKTLHGKLQRNYHELDHVDGQPFALAIADFHEPGSMVWSREALPTYLYGLRADVEGEGADRRAIGTPIANLIGKGRAVSRPRLRASLCRHLQQRGDASKIQPNGISRRLAARRPDDDPARHPLRSDAWRTGADRLRTFGRQR